jgi:hypothetical protein
MHELYIVKNLNNQEQKRLSFRVLKKVEMGQGQSGLPRGNEKKDEVI